MPLARGSSALPSVLLLAALKSHDGESICLIRGLQSTQSGNGFDCPVLKMSHIIFSIPSLHIMKSVSVLHECGPDMQVCPENH